MENEKELTNVGEATAAEEDENGTYLPVDKPLEETPVELKEYFAVVLLNGDIDVREVNGKKENPDKAEKDPEIKIVSNIYPARDAEHAKVLGEKIIEAQMAFYDTLSKRLPDIDPSILN